MPASPEIMRTEFVLKAEDGDARDWFDSFEAAVEAAKGYDEPTFVERVDEFFPDKTVVWVSHRSMVDLEGQS